MTYEQIRRDEEIRTYIEKADTAITDDKPTAKTRLKVFCIDFSPLQKY